MLGKPLDLQLSEPDPNPSWIVDDLMERGACILFSADSGAGKSFLCMHLASCLVRGEPWLGKRTHGSRVMFIDNENHPRIVRKRLRMLGMDGHEPQVRYFNRLGVQLGAGAWLERTLAEIEDFKPDIIVLDTVSSTTKAITPPDGGGGMGGGNEAIAYLYATVLRPLAGTERAVILQHHEKKPQAGVKRDARYSVLGGMQWFGQADSMFSVERKGDVFEDGDVRRYPVELTLVKDRDGNSFKVPMAFSSRMEDGRLRGWIERWETD